MSTHPDLAAIVEEHFPCRSKNPRMCGARGLMQTWDGTHYDDCPAKQRDIALRVAVAAARWERERLAEIVPHMIFCGDSRHAYIIAQHSPGTMEERDCIKLGGKCAIREAGKMEGGE